MIIKHRNGRREGAILLVTLVVFSVLSMLGIYVANIGINDTVQARETESRTKAHYLAVSGVEIARGIVNAGGPADPKGIYYGNLSESSKADFGHNQLGEGFDFDNLRSEVESFNSANDYDIVFGIAEDPYGNLQVVSIGNRGSSSRTVSLGIRSSVAGIPVFDMAIFGTDKLTLTGNGSINGPIGSNNEVIIEGSSNPTVTIFVQDEADVILKGSNKGEALTIVSTLTELTYKLPSVPALPNRTDIEVGNGSSTIGEDGHYETIGVGSGATLIIDATDSDRMISVDELDLKGNITVDGTGTVFLYVLKELKETMANLNVSGTNTAGNWARLIIVDSREEKGKKDKLKLSGHSDLAYVGVYAPETDFEMSGKSGLLGSVIAKTVKLTGNGNIDFEFGTGDLGSVLLPVGEKATTEIWSD